MQEGWTPFCRMCGELYLYCATAACANQTFIGCYVLEASYSPGKQGEPPLARLDFLDTFALDRLFGVVDEAQHSTMQVPLVEVFQRFLRDAIILRRFFSAQSQIAEIMLAPLKPCDLAEENGLGFLGVLE